MRKTINIFLLIALAICVMSGTIDLSNLFNYSNQPLPPYITRDNTNTNLITNEGATLGRVLFYDKKLSSNDSISCSSCHKQSFAFGDTSTLSQGVNGLTKRHSMRLINSRFASIEKFFWDRRANTLEEQATMPIQDHLEMGFSGTNGDPSISDLLQKLDAISYYNDLFYLAYGDTVITEARIQLALAQFIRSIQSFDSKYDQGLAAVGGNLNASFPNFTTQENMGKTLFTQLTIFNFQLNDGIRIGGGLGCNSCHRDPEFDLDSTSKNNGVITVAGSSTAVDISVTRAPSLRDLFNPSGDLNGPLMHDGSFKTFDEILTHYDQIHSNIQINPDLDSRLTAAIAAGSPSNTGINLMMTNQERAAVTAFIKTLTGTALYTDPKWSDPFDANGQLTIVSSPLGIQPSPLDMLEFKTFPNPVANWINIKGKLENKMIVLHSLDGKPINQWRGAAHLHLDLTELPQGIYIINVLNEDGTNIGSHRIIKS